MNGGQMADMTSMSGDGFFGVRPPPGLDGEDGQRNMNFQADPRSIAGGALARMFGGGASAPGGIHKIPQDSMSMQLRGGADDMSDPLGMPQAKPQIDPRALQMMMALRGMGGMGGMGAAQGAGDMRAMQGMPAPQVQPGALMGAMPQQMPQGGFRPRGMAGRF